MKSFLSVMENLFPKLLFSVPRLLLKMGKLKNKIIKYQKIKEVFFYIIVIIRFKKKFKDMK